MPDFWIFQDYQYARVPNLQSHAGFIYFHKYGSVLNMRQDAILEGFWIFQNSEYTKSVHMQALRKVLRREY